VRRFLVSLAKAPRSIQIAAAILVSIQAYSLWVSWPQTLPRVRPAVFVGMLLPLIVWWMVTIWAVVATLRVSRWPLLVLGGLFLASVAWAVSRFAFTREAWIALAKLVGVPLLLFALTVPHWRRMNWAFLGRSEPKPHVADTFS
jgi:hypothetical protein